MDIFCGDKQFWDSNLTWTGSSPDFPSCFMDTVLIWIPCFFLWILCPYEILRIRKSKDGQNPWTLLNSLKITLGVSLIGFSTTELIHSLIETKNNFDVNPVDYTTPIIKLISFILATILLWLHQMKGVHSSGVLTIFWLMSSFGFLAKYRAILSFSFVQDYFNDLHLNDYIFITQAASFPILFAEFLLAFYPDIRSASFKPSFKYKKECPVKSASFISEMTFWWFNAMIYLGYKRPLTQDDMWLLSKENQTKEVIESFDENYVKKDKNKINIVWPLLNTFKFELLIMLMIKLIASCLIFVNPIVLDYLISFMSNDEPTWRGYFYAITMLLSSFATSILNGQAEYGIYKIGMRMRAAMISSIYKKCLVLSTSGKKDFTTGEIVNLMAVDTQRVIDFVHYMMELVVCPLEVIISLYLLYNQLGISTIAGFVVILIFIPINGYATKKYGELQGVLMKEKDKRTKLMNEIFNGIKILKMYAWEPSFIRLVKKIRESELDALRIQSYYSSVITFAFTCAPFFMALACFTTFIFIDSSNVLNANIAFVSLSLINMLGDPLTFLNIVVNYGAMFLISIRRINKYLNGDELSESNLSHEEDLYNSIEIKNGSFSWSEDKTVQLKDISITIPKGNLVAVVGQVGSGKSSLLSALLGEMDIIHGSVNVSGSVAYAPQQAWIQNATLRENILFSNKYEPNKYNAVIEACALKTDLDILEGGDMTEIGEKGINLSGGQKQRVSLARSVYSDADIYYFDDPLSAVDSHVGKHIFDKVVGPKGVLRYKTRILVTHKITLLPQVDMILVMKDGRISEQGSYEELLAKKGDFAEYLVQYLVENANDESDDEENLSVLADLSESLRPELDKMLSRRESQYTRQESVKRRGSLAKQKTKQTDRKPSKLEIKGKLVSTETAETGSIKSVVYYDYVKAIGGWSIILTISGYATAYGFNIGQSLWLTSWSSDSNDPITVNDTQLRNLRLGVYATLGIFEAIFTLVSTIAVNLTILRGCKYIHNDMLNRIFMAPMSFYDTTPPGRILNRFSKDIDTADISVRNNIRLVMIMVFKTLVAIIIISLETPLFLVALIPLGLIYYFMQKFYISTSRQLRRIESTGRSPIYTHFSETVSGASSIRAYEAVERFKIECNDRVDVYHTSYFPNLSAARWLSVRLEFLGYAIVFLSAIFAVVLRDTMDPGTVGLAISYSLTITLSLSLLVSSYSNLETDIVSIERCLEYTKTPIEKEWYIESTKPDVQWPRSGVVRFQNYSTRYREGLDLVLKNITCTINANEKVGIVGRTGAGKSSLTLAFFRIVEPVTGTIFIDDVDISKLGLNDLRSHLTIIPQDPVLFTGLLRINLDPFNKYTDDDLWRSLELAHLKPFVDGLPGGFDYEIAEEGENLSVGQRQLICLARALLRKSKILILDEATAGVDFETDELIQNTIRTEFNDCTILTIAHRLNTVMDYDRIIVMDNGSIAEFESPKTLLDNQESIFYSMAKDAGLV